MTNILSHIGGQQESQRRWSEEEIIANEAETETISRELTSDDYVSLNTSAVPFEFVLIFVCHLSKECWRFFGAVGRKSPSQDFLMKLPG